MKMLPGAEGPEQPPVRATAPTRQLSDLPKDELENLAEEYGIDPTRFRTRQHLVAAIHDRRQLIALLDRDAMLDVILWGRRPVPANATKEHLALEIARIKSMRFAGLSQRGMIVLARLRGVRLRGDETVPELVRKLRKAEGFFSRINRKRRALLGSIVSSMVGDADAQETEAYRFLPPQSQPGAPNNTTQATPPPQSSIKQDIEESGLIGGITGRLRKSADTYVNQKLDEIEARIDRKLDEIDRRLADWRDKEIANRLLILKITLWASVIVAGISLIYVYVVTYLPFLFR
jgi:hypothetical protein